MPAISPFLWFDQQAEEAAHFYVSIFPNSRVVSTMHAQGQVLGVTFELDGRTVMALNGGPRFKFTEAISLFVSCDSQEEIDRYWDQLLAGGGEPSMCGWLKDRYGLSWQVVPSALGAMMGDADPQRGQRVMEALLQMRKIDLPTLERARQG